MRFRFHVGLFLAALAAGSAATPPPTADAVVKQAVLLARKTHKNVLLDFGASWCPWCRQFEKLLETPEFGPKFQAGYVIAHITVQEVPAKAALQNKGWEGVMARYRPTKDQDIPYLVILDGRGRKLADSYEPAGQRIPNNAGFPQTDAEITAYLKLIRSTSHAFSKKDLSALEAYFKNVRKASPEH